MSTGLVGRTVLGAVGVAVGLWGAWLALQFSFSTQLGIGRWLVGGVVLHDFVLAPLTVAGWWAARRFLPAVVSGPAAGGVVVLAAITIMAIPVLGKFRTVASNPTLLDRDYTQGWLIVAGIVVVGVVAWSAELAVGLLGRDRDGDGDA